MARARRRRLRLPQPNGVEPVAVPDTVVGPRASVASRDRAWLPGGRRSFRASELASLGIVLASAACTGTPHHLVPSRKPTLSSVSVLTTIGRLEEAASDRAAWPSHLNEPPFLSQQVRHVPCADFARFTGHDPYYLAAPPTRAARPVCYVDISRDITGAPKAKPDSGGLIYVPDRLWPARDSFAEIMSAGGVLVGEAFNRGGALPPPQTDIDARSGIRHAAHTTINGHPAYVVALGGVARISVELFETDPHGSRTLLQVQALYGPDELVEVARTLTTGLPPNERPA